MKISKTGWAISTGMARKAIFLQISCIWFMTTRSSIPVLTLSETINPRGVFSDLDGTLLHYPTHFTSHGVIVVKEDPVGQVGIVRDKDGEARLCRLFRSSALGNGFMSYRYCE